MAISAKALEAVDAILRKAKVHVTRVEEVPLQRGEGGRFIKGSAKTRLFLEGPGVKAAINRNYFKKVRVPKIQEIVPGAAFPRVRRGTGQAVLELVA